MKMPQTETTEYLPSYIFSIAHDFKNLLSIIMGLSELLMEDLPDNSIEYQNANDIFLAGTRCGDLIKEFISFHNRTEQTVIPTKIESVLCEVISLYRSKLPPEIEITHDIKINGGLIKTDSINLYRIIMNLMDNAYQAVEDSAGQISVQLKEIELGDGVPPISGLPPGRYALLSVSDTGCGIDPAVIEDIFNPYFTTNEQKEGHGFGLSVVYEIVKNLHGEIKVRSEVGKATIFNVYIPLIKRH